MWKPLSCLALAVLTLTGCATTRSLPADTPTVRVLSFSLGWRVLVDSPLGQPERGPGLLTGNTPEFQAPLREAVAKMWPRFLDAVKENGVAGDWVGPDVANSVYQDEGTGLVDPLSITLGPSAAKGFVWPEGFLYFEANRTTLRQLSEKFPGEWLVVVEQQPFRARARDANAFDEGTFKMGLQSRLLIVSPQGELWAESVVVGYSRDEQPRLSMGRDRVAYPDLLLQAQEDVLAQWLRGPLRTGSLEK